MLEIEENEGTETMDRLLSVRATATRTFEQRVGDVIKDRYAHHTYHRFRQNAGEGHHIPLRIWRWKSVQPPSGLHKSAKLKCELRKRHFWFFFAARNFSTASCYSKKVWFFQNTNRLSKGISMIFWTPRKKDFLIFEAHWPVRFLALSEKSSKSPCWAAFWFF